jgi:Rrf2 family transcriptional regulator, iron-sulfur cluster assembly transcription factor
MLYSSACEYAIRALTHLADHPERRVKLREVSEVEGIPAPFLANIFHRLVGAGILTSARGPTGGYALVSSAADLTLLQIKAAVDGLADLEACAVGLERCSDEMPCPLHDQWKPIRARIRAFLEGTTLQTMADARARKEAARPEGGAVGSRGRKGGEGA